MLTRSAEEEELVVVAKSLDETQGQLMNIAAYSREMVTTSARIETQAHLQTAGKLNDG